MAGKTKAVEEFQQNPWEIIVRHIDIRLPSALCEQGTQNQPHTNHKWLKQNTLLIIVYWLNKDLRTAFKSVRDPKSRGRF